MEYFLGSLATIPFVVLYQFIKTNNKKFKISKRHTQSHIHNLIYPNASLYSQVYKQTIKETQSYKFREQIQLRVLVIEDKAYWITNNTVFVADVIEGKVDSENAKTIDTMGMDSVQLDKMMFIVDKLTEGISNDYRGPGYN